MKLWKTLFVLVLISPYLSNPSYRLSESQSVQDEIEEEEEVARS